MTLNVNSLLCRHFYACCDQQLTLESQGFRCKVALYFSYMHIKFDDEIRRGSLDLGPQSRVVWFSTSWHHILKTVRDRAYRSQLITNRTSFI